MAKEKLNNSLPFYFYCKITCITVGRIIFKDIKFRGYSKFHFNKKFRGKHFEVIGNPRNFYRT